MNIFMWLFIAIVVIFCVPILLLTYLPSKKVEDLEKSALDKVNNNKESS